MIDLAVSAWMQAPAPATRRIFAIGDVHGQIDLLDAMHGHLAGLPVEDSGQPVLVHLGDYIDRGPHSMGALEAALTWWRPGWTAVALPGNHEQLMLQFLDAKQGGSSPEWQENTLDLWLGNGGAQVCAELGVSASGDTALVAEAVGEALAPLLARLRALPAAAWFPPYLFVHAGLPRAGDGFVAPSDVPGMDWRAELPGARGFDEAASPLWVRMGFLEVATPWPEDAVVIHGHTIFRNGPDIRDNRIGLDVGAFKYGRLAMIEILGDRMRFHVATRPRVKK